MTHTATVLHHSFFPIHGGNTPFLLLSINLRLISHRLQLSAAFYNTFVKRNSEPKVDFLLPSLFTRLRLLTLIGVYVTSIFVGAFAFGVGFDVAVSNFWDNWNRGVCPSFFLRITIRRFNDCVPPLYAETMEGYST